MRRQAGQQPASVIGDFPGGDDADPGLLGDADIQDGNAAGMCLLTHQIYRSRISAYVGSFVKKCRDTGFSDHGHGKYDKEKRKPFHYKIHHPLV